MKLIGLTGGVGMGKSTAAGLFEASGVPIIDTDQIARDVVRPGEPGLQELVDSFGANILAGDGNLDRRKLAEIVFSDEAARKRVEVILHPLIRKRWLLQAKQWSDEKQQLGLVVIPLLFETDAAGHFEKIISVASTAASQRERLLERGWTPKQSEQRIRAQWPVHRKIDLAHFVIWTEGDLAAHAAQIGRILKSLGFATR